jgi:serine/threonine protein kinase
MVTGKPAWNFSGSNIWSLLIRIGIGEELPLIPDELSQEGKDFLQKIFVKDPLKRWTTKMLLKHPFISDDKNVSLVKELINESSSLPSPSSPRTHFDFSTEFEHDFCSPEERLQGLVEDPRFVRLVN